MHSERYSPQIKQRYRATVAEDGTVLNKKWPMACGGAANAFLALVGPSMGGAGSGEAVKSGGANRPHRWPMQIGSDVQTFDWGDHRVTRWNRLCAAMLGAEQYVPALTALLNLDWRHSTSESAIPQDHLETGFTRYVWPLLQLLQPRIVCPLTNRVWDIIAPRIENFRVSFVPCSTVLTRQPIFFQLPDSDFVTMLVKPHNHPSRALSYDQISQVGEACTWFLNQRAS